MAESTKGKRQFNLSQACNALFVSLVAAGSLLCPLGLPADALVRPHTLHLQHLTIAEHGGKKTTNYGKLPHRPAYASRFAGNHKHLTAKQLQQAKLAAAKRAQASKAIPPQNSTDDLVSVPVAPGVVHRYCRSPLNIHILDIDMARAPVKVQPYLAGEQFDRLRDVEDHARECKAIAAINANYFKKDGTPLGTLIIDGEWVAGPIYDRVSLGISRTGVVKIDRVSLNGVLTSNNPNASRLWVNNINQPRRTGCHLVAYTRRWGPSVHMDYAGCLVAVNAQGEVMDKSTTAMGIPYGGYVLSDSKDSAIDNFERGDKLQITWQTKPGDWQDVVEAVSGGPMLIKDGNLFLDLKDENFKKGWTGSQIRARTVVGVTRDNHLLLATIEGPHTLWDCAKFLHKLGAVDAMNLDGGGSTTMVVNGQRVTGCSHQRRVAASIVVLDMRKGAILESHRPGVPGQTVNLSAMPKPASVADVTAAEVTATLPVLVSPDSAPPVKEASPLTQGALGIEDLSAPGMAPGMVP
jgi:uncharacterized protein YigE (DUF2233 family)